MDVSSSPAGEAEATEHAAGGLMNAVDAVPFMLHVLLVLWISWLLLPVNLTGLFLLCFFIVYLFQVERRAREIEQRGIASAERRKINTRRTFDEGETSRWLNEGIKSMWPLGMEVFASRHFFGPMAPYFLDKYMPSWIVKEAKMDIRSLGSTPPVFNFIRALEQPPEGDHVAYEANMEFHSDHDMNAELRVLNTTFYISRLHIEGKVKISVKFLNGWPVVGRVRLCFASIPQVTMSYKPYNLLDVSLIPGVANLVESMLHKAMEDSIVQPNMLEVDIEALAASLLFPDSRPRQGAIENKSTLLVEILEATYLRVADRNGRSDPFVNIHFGGRKKKTKVIRKNLHPKWTDEKHEFSIKNWDLPNFLVLHVQDWDRVRYRTSPNLGCSIFLVVLLCCLLDIGMLTVDLKKLYEDGKKFEFGKRYEFFQSLEGVSTGQLRFAITVNHPHPGSSNFEEPGTSDAGFETVTQEIKSDYVVYSAPSRVGATTEMKRSKSDTNLNKLRSTPAAAAQKYKGKAKRSTLDPTGNNDTTTTNKTNLSMEALKDQMVIDETHDIIDMPYGPRGAFTIRHPGSLVQQGEPSSREDTANGQMTPKSAAAAGMLDKVDGAAVHEGQAAEALGKALPSWLPRNPFRGRGKKRTLATGMSQESNVLTETMSEQSEPRDSNDMLISTDELRRLSLDQLSHQYHGPVRMDRIDTPVDVAPDEPPDMYTPTTSLPPPIHSYNGKTALTAPASSSHVHAELLDHTSTVIHASSEPQRHVPRNNINGTTFSGFGPTESRTANDDDDGESVPDDHVPHAPSSPPRPPQRQSTGKSMPSWLPMKWYQKIRSLAAKGGKKKTTTTTTPVHGAAAVNSNGMAYSSELNAEDGYHADQGYHRHHHPAEESQDWDRATTSRTQSFTIEYSSPLDVNNSNNNNNNNNNNIKQLINNGSTPGDSPADDLHEQRNLMQETPLSRSAGSQSDRSNWASKMKKLVRYQSKSKSLRFEKPKLKPPPLPLSASLNGIAERSAGPVNTKVTADCTAD